MSHLRKWSKFFPAPSVGQSRRRILVSGVILAAVCGVTHAQSVWLPTAGGTYTWTTASNWSGGVPNSSTALARLTANATGAQTVNLNSGITVNQLTLGGVLTGSGGYTVAAGGATGTLTFGGSSPLVTASAGSPSIQASVVLGSSTTFTVNSGVTLGVTGVVSGAASSLTKNGTGTLVLSGLANTYGGGTSVTAGVLQVASDGSLGSASAGLTIGSATLTVRDGAVLSASRTVTLTSGATVGVPVNEIGTIESSLGGGGSLTKSDLGELRLTGSVAYLGSTTVNAGTLSLSGPATLTSTSGITVASGAALAVYSDPNPSGTPKTVLSTGTVSVTGGTLTVGLTGNGLDRSFAAANVAVATSLSVTGSGFVDLQDNDLILRATSLADMNAKVASLQQAVKSWLSGTGTGLGSGVSDDLTAAVGTRLTSLAIFPNYVAANAGYYVSYDGVTLGAFDIIVKYAAIGDTNLDGVLDGQDYKALAEGITFGSSGWANGDFDYSGSATNADFTAYGNALNVLNDQGFNPDLGSGQAVLVDVTQIPEPVAIGVLAPALALLGRRRTAIRSSSRP